MSMTRPKLAFYAPMKPPDHPNPSGDRQIARLSARALEKAGFEVTLTSRLRILDRQGDARAQERLREAVETETRRLVAALAPDPPDLWYSYHSHYKAPDLLGPRVAGALAIPYVLSEPSISPRRREGPWAEFARASEVAVAAATRLFWTTERDRPALEAAGHGAKMRHLPAFIETGPAPALRPPRGPEAALAMVTLAMMRPGDKFESYRRLAAGLARLAPPWTLEVIGDGPERARVMALFAGLPGQVRFHGALEDRAAIRARLEAALLYVWPGVGEGVGLAWIEAQAAGLPVIAEDGPAARAVVHAGRLTPPGDAEGFAEAIRQVAEELPALGAKARQRAEAEHGLDAAAQRLGRYLGEVLS